MEIRNCRSCGKLFNYIGGVPLCPTCQKELDDKFSTVKEYIYNNPKATIQQISEENEVSISQLKQWVREERLCFSEDSPIGLSCENCGALIRTGRFCPVCKEKMSQQIAGAYGKEKKQERTNNMNNNPKMRFLDF